MDRITQLITPAIFRDEYAPGMSVNAVRDLFHIEGFPSVKVGVRMFTTRKASEKWLSCIGKFDLLGEEAES